MKRFKTFLNEAFTHAVHLEDLVLDMGVKGTRDAINALRDFRDAFAGNTNNKNLNLSVKWDGAPAVIWGTNPENGRFFVASKSLFNKNPKIYYSAAEVKAGESGGKAEKLIDAVTYLPAITPKGRIFQGDFLYSKSDLKIETIGGEKQVTMHPNTIVYSVPIDTKLGKDILKSEMGIVVHTEYNGSTIDTLKASFGVSTSGFKTSPKVWLQDATYTSEEGYGNFTKAEASEMDRILSMAGKLFKSTSSSTFKLLSTDPEFNMMVNTFNNSIVRAGKTVDPKVQADMFVKWLEDRFQKEIDKRKSPAGKLSQQAKLDELHAKVDKKELTNIFMLQAVIKEGKKLVLNKLNEIGNISTFVKDKNGFKVTNHEGFVGISGGIAGVKLVDRLEFSHNNFSSDIIKGWESSTRG